MDTHITQHNMKFRRLGHLASAICAPLHMIKLLFPLNPSAVWIRRTL